MSASRVRSSEHARRLGAGRRYRGVSGGVAAVARVGWAAVTSRADAGEARAAAGEGRRRRTAGQYARGPGAGRAAAEEVIGA